MRLPLSLRPKRLSSLLSFSSLHTAIRARSPRPICAFPKISQFLCHFVITSFVILLAPHSSHSSYHSHSLKLGARNFPRPIGPIGPIGPIRHSSHHSHHSHSSHHS